jgi:hypothetical protein
LLPLLLLNIYIIKTITFAISAIFGVLFVSGNKIIEDEKSILFPYFLVPSGIPSIYGISNFYDLPNEPFLSALIIVSIVITLFLLFILSKLVKVKLSESYLIIVMFFLLLNFHYFKRDYASFKIVMYLQPILVLIIIYYYSTLDKYKKLAKLFVSAILIFQIYIQKSYVMDSAELSQKIGPILNISNAKLLNKFNDFMTKIDNDSIYISDPAIRPLAVFQSLLNNDNRIYEQYQLYERHYSNKHLPCFLFPICELIKINLQRN